MTTTGTITGFFVALAQAGVIAITVVLLALVPSSSKGSLIFMLWAANILPMTAIFIITKNKYPSFSKSYLATTLAAVLIGSILVA